MDTLIMVLSIVFLAFGILQIILFFKVWAMTNDVRNIRDKFLFDINSLSFDDLVEKSKEDIHVGDFDESKKMLSRLKYRFENEINNVLADDEHENKDFFVDNNKKKISIIDELLLKMK